MKNAHRENAQQPARTTPCRRAVGGPQERAWLQAAALGEGGAVHADALFVLPGVRGRPAPCSPPSHGSN